MAKPIENAKKRLAAIRAEAAEIEAFIAMYERFEDRSVAGFRASMGGNSGETSTVDSLAVDKFDCRRNGPRPAEIANMMERLIREVGRPMTRGEIVRSFDARDFEIPAKDKGRYLGTIAWRNKGKFLNIEGRGYWLRDRPLVAERQVSHFFSETEEPA